jgi:hypothetical protein
LQRQVPVTTPEPTRDAVSRSELRHASLHLTAQATVEFAADQLWPLHGDYSRFGVDLQSFAHELTRRLQTDGYIGYRLSDKRITLIPLGSIKRIDVNEREGE